MNAGIIVVVLIIGMIVFMFRGVKNLRRTGIIKEDSPILDFVFILPISFQGFVLYPDRASVIFHICLLLFVTVLLIIKRYRSALYVIPNGQINTLRSLVQECLLNYEDDIRQEDGYRESLLGKPVERYLLPSSRASIDLVWHKEKEEIPHSIKLVINRPFRFLARRPFLYELSDRIEPMQQQVGKVYRGAIVELLLAGGLLLLLVFLVQQGHVLFLK
jgi:Ca2+/Na+ antiporter